MINRVTGADRRNLYDRRNADGAVDRKNIKELNEGNRTGELQENRGRSETTGQAPTREQNRVYKDKKSDRARLAPAAPPK